MSKKKNPPIAFDTDYLEYETVTNDNDNEDIISETDISELESDMSDKNDQEQILKEVEEMNNKYSFIPKKKKKIKKKHKENNKTIELKEEVYLSD